MLKNKLSLTHVRPGIDPFFLKHFIIAFVVQVAVIALGLSTGIAAGFVYIFYMVPYALVDTVIPLPAQIGEGRISFFLLLCLPAIFYSTILGLAMVAINKIRNRGGERL